MRSCALLPALLRALDECGFGFANLAGNVFATDAESMGNLAFSRR
jgi:hypothetical protein